MPTYIGLNNNGLKYYKNALSPREIKEAENFRIELENSISILENELKLKYKENSLEYKHSIGVFLMKKIVEKNIPDFEVEYLIEMIKDWVQSNIKTGKDNRGKKRLYYNYCLQLSKFDVDTVLAFTWRHWSELLDRTIIIKDLRVIKWLKDEIKNISNAKFRMFLMALNLYLQNHDTTILNYDEISFKYKVFLTIVDVWFDQKIVRNNTKVKSIKDTTKHRKKYLSECFKLIKFKEISEIRKIGTDTIYSLFKQDI